MGQDWRLPVGGEPGQEVGAGRGGRVEEVCGGEAPVEQDEHAGMHGPGQAATEDRLARFPGSEYRVDHRSCSAGDQRDEQDLRISRGSGVLVGRLAQLRAHSGLVGDVQMRAVDRDDQQSRPPGAGGADCRGRSAQQVEQGPHRTYSEPAAGLPQRCGTHPWHRQPGQGARKFEPHRRVPALFEQSRREQDIDHDPGRELTYPFLDGPALGEHRIDHFERHELGQLTQMPWCEHPTRYRDFTADDTLIRQRSLR